MNRRTVLAASLVGLAAAAGLAWYLSSAERSILGAAATPDGGLLLTATLATPTLDTLEHVGTDGARRWSVPLSPLAATDRLGFTSFAPADDLVVVLAGDTVLALDRATGAQRWQILLPGTSRTADTPGPVVLVDSPRVYLLRTLVGDGPDRDSVDAISLTDGAHLWSHAAAPRSTIHFVGPGRLVHRDLDTTGELLDATTGESQGPARFDAIACAIPDALVTIQANATVLLPATGGTPTTLPGPAWHTPETPCGVRDDDLVHAIFSPDTGSNALVRRDRRTGEARWTLDLKARRPQAQVTVDGRLPRLLPITSHEDTGDKLGVIDLDTGKEIRQGPIDGIAVVLASSERAAVFFQATGTLAALDPNTGGIVQASALPAAINLTLRPDDLRFGVAWISGSGSARRLPWAAFDLTTGAFLHTNGDLFAGDRTAELRTRLGW